MLEGDDSNPLGSRLEDVTNKDGAYFFENITVGTKTIRASRQGYNGSSVEVKVLGNTTVSAPYIVLSKETGSVSGRVINEILERHNVNEGLFPGEISLYCNEIGG